MLAEVRVAVATGRSEQQPCACGRPIQCRGAKASRSGTTPSVTLFCGFEPSVLSASSSAVLLLPRPPARLVVNCVRSERHLVRRTRQALSRDTDDWFFVNLHQDGRCVLTQDGRDQQVNAGDLCLFDSTRPFDLDFPTDMALTCFLVPRGALLARTVNAPGAVVREIPKYGAGALLYQFSAGLAAKPLRPCPPRRRHKPARYSSTSWRWRSERRRALAKTPGQRCARRCLPRSAPISARVSTIRHSI